jgi:hypothetical protein
MVFSFSKQFALTVKGKMFWKFSIEIFDDLFAEKEVLKVIKNVIATHEFIQL